MIKYGKYGSDGLWSINWMRRAMVDEMNGTELVCEQNIDVVVVR